MSRGRFPGSLPAGVSGPLSLIHSQFLKGVVQALGFLGPALCILQATRTGGRVGVSHQEGSEATLLSWESPVSTACG